MSLTQSDLDAIKNLIEITIDEKFEGRLGLSPDQTLDEKFNHLPTKEEFYNKTDELIKELRDMREELTILNGRVSIHSDQIEALKKLHPKGKHQSN